MVGRLGQCPHSVGWILDAVDGTLGRGAVHVLDGGSVLARLSQWGLCLGADREQCC